MRDTFTSAAHEARILPLDLKVRIHHPLASSDNLYEGYIWPSVEHFRDSVERVATFMRKKTEAEGKPALRSVG
ncbi:MAG: hypothetical protein ACI8QS_003065 [Planctomycetota bacterium]|jgi:hypothetical protein